MPEFFEKIVVSFHASLAFVYLTHVKVAIYFYDIYASFEQSPILELRANVLDISKAFHKV